MTGLETALAGAAVKEAAGPAKGLIAKFGRPAYDRFIVELCNCFQAHVDNSYERCRYVKNVLYRDSSVDLKSQYVNVIFDQSGTAVQDKVISEIVRKSGRLIVSGTAGAGKTMFMKWLTLNLIDDLVYHQKIPLFLELRYITEDSIKGGFLSYLLNNTSKAEGRVSIDRFKIGLELGQFILILDAVDEIKPSIRDTVIDEIRAFLREYPDCSVLLSSRPDEELESIQEVAVYRTKSMDESQVIEVIKKLQFDELVKRSLLAKFAEGFFNEHSEFLSNPLLVTIMLLNFDHSADIPTKLTSFYRQAFEALYQRHDAAKGAYRRGHYAGLPLDEYEKVFSAFSFDSFLDSKVEFSDVELLDYFRAAALYYNVSATPNDLVLDAMKSVCVIQREGLDNVFAHRTFQEYFAALFLSRYREDDFVEQVKDTTSGWRNNNVLKMLIELAPEAVEQEWLAPSMKSTATALRKVKCNSMAGAARIFKAFYSSIEVGINSGDILGFSNGNEQAGGRLSLIGMAYTPQITLTRAIFDGPPIFTSLNDYMETNKEIEFPSDIYDRTMTIPDDESSADGKGPVETIEIGVSDIGWLMKSGLPDRLGDVKRSFLEFYDGMEERIAQRSTAMERLRTRHARPSPIRRPKKAARE